MWSEFPDVRYVFDDAATYMKNGLNQAKYQLVLKMLPDISDEEAKILFGQTTNAETVHQHAVEDIEVGRGTSETMTLLRQVIEQAD